MKIYKILLESKALERKQECKAIERSNLGELMDFTLEKDFQNEIARQNKIINITSLQKIEGICLACI